VRKALLMWRRLSAGKGAFNEVNSYELVATEEEDSANENHRLLTNGYRRQQTATGNNIYSERATDNTLISSSFGDANQNHYSSRVRKRLDGLEGEDGGEDYTDGAVEGDSWDQQSNNNSRKMLRRSSERDANRISSIDNPNYCSVNMAMSVDDVTDVTRTQPDNRRASSPYNVMSTADDAHKSSESSGCFRAFAKFLRCSCL